MFAGRPAWQARPHYLPTVISTSPVNLALPTTVQSTVTTRPSPYRVNSRLSLMTATAHRLPRRQNLTFPHRKNTTTPPLITPQPRFSPSKQRCNNDLTLVPPSSLPSSLGQRDHRQKVPMKDLKAARPPPTVQEEPRLHADVSSSDEKGPWAKRYAHRHGGEMSRNQACRCTRVAKTESWRPKAIEGEQLENLRALCCRVDELLYGEARRVSATERSRKPGSCFFPCYPGAR
ncbi:hypothetical protein LZ30DRAFT_460383 [Colletotrichum cereale]|nr:hypothetical protein LZ30DRAFT_460383 [Colletotrichum cereale]